MLYRASCSAVDSQRLPFMARNASLRKPPRHHWKDCIVLHERQSKKNSHTNTRTTAKPMVFCTLHMCRCSLHNFAHFEVVDFIAWCIFAPATPAERAIFYPRPSTILSQMTGKPFSAVHPLKRERSICVQNKFIFGKRN